MDCRDAVDCIERGTINNYKFKSTGKIANMDQEREEIEEKKLPRFGTRHLFVFLGENG